MDLKAQSENQQEIVNNNTVVTNPTQTVDVTKEQVQTESNAQPVTGKSGPETQETKVLDNSKNLQNNQKVVSSGDGSSDAQKKQKQENVEPQKPVQKDQGAEISQDKKDQNQTAVKDQTQQSNAQKEVSNKESQSKSQISKENPKGNSAASSQNEVKTETQRSEKKKETTNVPKKKESHDLKEKSAQGGKATDQNTQKSQKASEKTTTQKPQEKQRKQEVTLGGAFGSILSFFSATKNNLEGSSNKTISKLQEVVLQSQIVSAITGTEYKPLISSDILKKGETKGTEAENQKRARASRNPGPKKSTKVETENSNKTLTTESAKDKTLPIKDTSKLNVRKAISKPKLAEGVGSSPLKGKGEVEEQIRLHKIQEIKKMKKNLLEKLDGLNNQLFELEKPGLDSNRAADSPVRLAFNLEQYQKQQKEELEQRKKQALEFTKKMNHQRKELEQKREKRRDDQHALVIKDIDVFYQKQLDELATSKAGGSAKAKFEDNIKKLKQDNMFAALEEKKKGLKIMREFKINAGDEPTNTDDDQNDEKKKMIKKPINKSAVLAQVLKDDEAIKKIETEKTQAKKDLYKKKLEYSKEVKSTHLPQVHASKYTFDPDGKIAKAVHRSQNIEKVMIRNAGKDGLYGYLDKMRSKYPDIGKPRKNSEDESDIQDYKPQPEGKAKNKKPQKKQHYEEENEDYYGEEDMKNYELEEDVNLTDRAREDFSRDFQPKAKTTKNSKNKSYQQDLKRKSEALSDDDSGIEEKGVHPKFTKKHQVEQKGPKDEEDNEWEEELKNDQLVLKDKISTMLGDIKKIEAQMKQKEQKLNEDIDKRKHIDA